MSLVGMGRAFNLRFMPNGPLRTNCYHRPMPQIGMFGCGGNFSYTENINIQQGPSGFWGFMTGLTQGLFGGGMFGCGMGGGLFGLLNARQAAAPQGTEQAQGGGDKHLAALTQLLGNKGSVTSHPDKENIYILTTKDGKIIEGTFQELIDKFKDNPDNTGNTGNTGNTDPTATTTTTGNTDPTATTTTTGNTDPTATTTTTTTTTGNTGNTDPTATATTTTGNTRVGVHTAKHGVKVPAGWYRAPKGGDGQAMIANQTLRAGMTARQVTDIILNNKVNYLAEADRNKLAAEVEKYNPSIFKNGKVIEGADLSKLDIPSIDYIKKNYVGSNSGMRTTKGTREATGTYGNNTIGQTVTSKTGRYAKKVNNEWHYYAKDGTELLEAHIKKNDPDLWNKTHSTPPQTAKVTKGGGDYRTFQITVKDNNGKPRTFTARAYGIRTSDEGDARSVIKNLQQQLEQAGIKNVKITL